MKLDHLERLADDVGFIEHSNGPNPDPTQGHCTDDAGRLLGVLAPYSAGARERALCLHALDFLEHTHLGGGRFELRLGPDGEPTGHPSSDDADARAIEGLGTAAALAIDPLVQARARSLVQRTLAFRSRYPRAMAHAALGAVAILGREPFHVEARRLAADASSLLASKPSSGPWPWPEPRLTYSNPIIPEAKLELALVQGNLAAAEEALDLLAWLVATERRGNHFSFTPVGGKGPGELGPGFDQQPIEAWSMARACATALRATGDLSWYRPTQRAVAWFHGCNDVGVPLVDLQSGGGHDGLRRDGVNPNQGAESTIAAVATSLIGAGLQQVTPAREASLA